ncbi:uncharacterized protein LOC134565066 isoform X2 [Prinia subflava]|uniref:uncharacterized protein LOC134565066 isoform X2 n=1 Tax=Prinia subflava TaxID=208062 RepID=UPI002FE0711F
MVSTLVDGLFGKSDLLPFDVKQIGRMIFDGAGMIVFRQEWKDNCTNLLAQSSGAGQPLHDSSLSRLMGKHDDMITPQQQAANMQAEEVRATTQAAREAIRAASRVVVRPSPWSTIKQGESESFTHFVDHLQAAAHSSTLPPEAKGPVVADCLRQQCNSITKDILRSLPAGASLADMIKHVVKEEQLTPTQAAVRTLTSAMACFKCGQAGHIVVSCPQPAQPSPAVPPLQARARGPCWGCGKKGHLAKDCRSRPQGNGKGRGRAGRTQPPPAANARRPIYANPQWGREPSYPMPPQGTAGFAPPTATQW